LPTLLEQICIQSENAAHRIAVEWDDVVYALCSDDRLRHVRLGLGRGTIRIPTDAVDEYLAGRMVLAAGKQPTDEENLRYIRRG
jgi:hypothetical protein